MNDVIFDDSAFQETFINFLEKKKPIEEYYQAEIDDIYQKKFTPFLQQSAEMVLQEIKENATSILAENRKVGVEFKKHLLEEWGNAFDLFQIFLASCIGVGNDFCKEVASEHSADENYLLIALIGLQARGCEIGSEVLILLKNGFPDGAHARWRTLYEMSVIATFLSENGEEAAKRYILHSLIESTRGIQDYQKYCIIFGYEQFSEEKIAGMYEDRDELIRSFGKGFKEDYGWASDILRKKDQSLTPEFKANFPAIERATNFEHMHGLHRMASHNIHAGSKALTFRLGAPIGSIGWPIRGPSDTGFTDPASGTSIALYLLTMRLITERPQIRLLIYTNVLKLLADEIGDTYLEIDNRLQMQKE